MNRPVYTKMLPDNRHEYGNVIQHRGRPDDLIPLGVAATYEAACSAVGIKPMKPLAPPSR